MLQSLILTIEYQYTNVLKRIFTKVVYLLRKQHVVRQCKKANARSSTFGFCRHVKPTLKNQKSLPFPTAPEQNIYIIYTVF